MRAVKRGMRLKAKQPRLQDWLYLGLWRMKQEVRSNRLRVAVIIGRRLPLRVDVSAVSDVKLAAMILRAETSVSRDVYESLAAEFAWRSEMAALGIDYGQH